MRTASDIADWWDEQHRISKAALDEFVDEHPNWFGRRQSLRQRG
jgi:hypothetical protein